MQTDYTGYAFAVAVGVGGLMGYLKRGSLVSLVMGLLFCGTLSAGSYLVTQDPRNVHLSALATGALAAVMGNRFLKAMKFMPSGMVFLLSLVMFIRYAANFFL